MGLEEIRAAVSRSTSRTAMADAFREALGIPRMEPRRAHLISLEDHARHEERRTYRELMYQRTGALDRG